MSNFWGDYDVATLQKLLDQASTATASRESLGLKPLSDPSQNSWFDNAVGTLGNKLDMFNNSLKPLGGIKGTFNGLQNGLQILGGLYQLNNMKKGLSLARDNFNFQKSMGTKNLANQMKSYNNLLNDQLQFRAQMETGNKDAYKDQYEERKLS